MPDGQLRAKFAQVFRHAVLATKVTPIRVVVPHDEPGRREQWENQLRVVPHTPIGMVGIDEDQIVRRRFVSREHRSVGFAHASLDHTGERCLAIGLTVIRVPVDRDDLRVRRNVLSKEKRGVTAIAPYLHQPLWLGADCNFQKHHKVRERRRPTATWNLTNAHYPLIEIREEIGERKHRQGQPPS